jgi:hypothetical protein
MYMRCSYFEELLSCLNPGTPYHCDRVIRPADTHAWPVVRSHDFPELTAGYDTAGELFFKKATAFTPETFYADQGQGGRPGLNPESCVSQAGIQSESSTAEEGSLPFRHLLNQVRQAIVTMETMAKDLERDMEKAIGILALGLAEIMVRHHAGTDPDVLLNNLALALQKVKGREVRKTRLNPLDFEQTAASRDNLPGLVEHFETLRMEPDAVLTRGDCVIETDSGTIDATLENQFRMLMEAFGSVIESPRSG